MDRTNKHLAPDTKVGHLTVKERLRRGKNYYYRCTCDCGNIVNVDASKLEKKEQTNCRCRGNYLEIGKIYDLLTVKKRIRAGIYKCECKCGNPVTVRTSDVLLGRVHSCGCSIKPYNRKIRKDSSTGVRGVSINRRSGKYTAFIYQDGKNRYLGAFTDIEDALKARLDAEEHMKEGGKI